MKIPSKKSIMILIGLIVIGQVAFAFYAPAYTRERHSAELFATIGIRYDGTDLHKLNEGAHYFGQTIIGWTKFPSFESEAAKFAGLPKSSTVGAHMQERQNIVFRIDSPILLTPANVQRVLLFLNQKLAAYNTFANVHIELANVDYQITSEKRSYWSGALFVLAISLFLAAAFFISTSRNI